MITVLPFKRNIAIKGLTKIEKRQSHLFAGAVILVKRLSWACFPLTVTCTIFPSRLLTFWEPHLPINFTTFSRRILVRFCQRFAKMSKIFWPSSADPRPSIPTRNRRLYSVRQLRSYQSKGLIPDITFQDTAQQLYSKLLFIATTMLWGILFYSRSYSKLYPSKRKLTKWPKNWRLF